MNYIFEDGVERSIRESGFDSMNKEKKWREYCERRW
jgi:hypothetical protein